MGETNLNRAARCRNDTIVDLLLNHQNPAKSQNDSSAIKKKGEELLLATIRGDESLVRDILESGAEIDTRDIDGGPALQWAAWYGYFGIVITLLDHGADVNAEDGKSYIWKTCPT